MKESIELTEFDLYLLENGIRESEIKHARKLCGEVTKADEAIKVWERQREKLYALYKTANSAHQIYYIDLKERAQKKSYEKVKNAYPIGARFLIELKYAPRKLIVEIVDIKQCRDSRITSLMVDIYKKDGIIAKGYIPIALHTIVSSEPL
jgi:hypothetical protein